VERQKLIKKFFSQTISHKWIQWWS